MVVAVVVGGDVVVVAVVVGGGVVVVDLKLSPTPSTNLDSYLTSL